MALVKNNKAKIGETAEKQHLIHTFSAIFRKSPNLHQIHSTTKFSGSKYIFCFSRYIFIDSARRRNRNLPGSAHNQIGIYRSDDFMHLSCFGKKGAPKKPSKGALRANRAPFTIPRRIAIQHSKMFRFLNACILQTYRFAPQSPLKIGTFSVGGGQKRREWGPGRGCDLPVMPRPGRFLWLLSCSDTRK